MDTLELTHSDCLALVCSHGRSHTALIAIDGGRPQPLACFVRESGDVLVPTGSDPSLTRSATGRPVTISFGGEHAPWAITGVGLARPLGHHDRPRLHHALAMRYAFDNGILVRVARLSGHRLTDTAPVPAQRDGTAAPAPPQRRASPGAPSRR
ncbi:hypothetical protein [Prauserella endophytica]|uniref:Pyridoxamine 5'-phosphate oxidase putative domain-containing protein n=1 Tax=Prauserella endophytica TaxID=1592324 RepID=A0ABY2RYJ6_9PSEU|nr:hypothetical protein [Prauserella endophytica]TKG65273.1 hypothetical protein FCN18_27600 [Prauserella endophytica]